MFPTPLVRSACALFLLAPLCAAGVLTVGPTGSGAQFLQIQAAVDAAAAGDVILVRPGIYSQFQVDKPLRILGDGTGVVLILGAGFGAQVRDIAAGQELVLSGMEVRSTPSHPPQSVLTLENCAGTVVLQDLLLPDRSTFVVGLQIESCARVLLEESELFAGVPGGRGAILAQASELWLVDSEITGESFTETHEAGAAPGVELENSSLHVWRSRIRGGSCGTVLKLFGLGRGGAGILATTSTVDHFGGPGAEVSGGTGAFDSLLRLGQQGGPGVDLLQNSHARFQAAVPVVGGLNGGGLGQAPATRTDGSSSFTTVQRVFPTLASSAQQVQLGATFALTLRGNPGGYQVVFAALRTGPTHVIPQVVGFGLLDRTMLIKVASEVLPPSAEYTLNLRVPNLAALLGATLFFQSAERFLGQYSIGNPTLVTVTG